MAGEDLSKYHTKVSSLVANVFQKIFRFDNLLDCDSCCTGQRLALNPCKSVDSLSDVIAVRYLIGMTMFPNARVIPESISDLLVHEDRPNSRVSVKKVSVWAFYTTLV